MAGDVRIATRRAETPNGLEMSRPASTSILHQLDSPQLAGSAPSSC